MSEMGKPEDVKESPPDTEERGEGGGESILIFPSSSCTMDTDMAKEEMI